MTAYERLLELDPANDDARDALVDARRRAAPTTSAPAAPGPGAGMGGLGSMLGGMDLGSLMNNPMVQSMMNNPEFMQKYALVACHSLSPLLRTGDRSRPPVSSIIRRALHDAAHSCSSAAISRWLSIIHCPTIAMSAICHASPPPVRHSAMSMMQNPDMMQAVSGMFGGAGGAPGAAPGAAPSNPMAGMDLSGAAVSDALPLGGSPVPLSYASAHTGRRPQAEASAPLNSESASDVLLRWLQDRLEAEHPELAHVAETMRTEGVAGMARYESHAQAWGGAVQGG